MSTRRILLPTLFLSLVLAAALAYLAGRPVELRARTTGSKAPPPEAVVSFVAGDVQARSGSGPWRPARRGQALTPGTAIRTGAGGRAELTLRGQNGRLRLDGNTRLTLQLAGLVLGGRVESGSVWTELTAGRPGLPPFVLGSGDVTATASEAVYRVHVVRSDSVRIAVYRGNAAVGLTEAPNRNAEPRKIRELPEGQALAVSQDGHYRLEEIGPDEDWRDGWLCRDVPASPGSQVSQEKAGRVVPLRKELTDISPEVYVSVQLELKGTGTQTTSSRPEQVQIRRIRIRSRQWDGLEPARKVELLNHTFSLLKGRYPGMLHSVVLEFDDGRPDLALKYGNTASG